MDPLLERAQDALSTARAAEAVVLIIAGGLAIASLSIILWKRWYSAADGRVAEADAHRTELGLPALTPSLLFACGLMVWLAGQVGAMAAYGPAPAALRPATIEFVVCPSSFWISMNPNTSASISASAATILSRCRVSSAAESAPRQSSASSASSPTS